MIAVDGVVISFIALALILTGGKAFEFVRNALFLKREKRRDARKAFIDAVRSHKKACVDETLALFGPDLTKYEKNVLEELKSDFVIEEDEKSNV